MLQLRVLPAQVRWQLGLARPGVLVDVTKLTIPDSPAARRAEEHCREVSPPYLVNHCLRTYLWAQVLAHPAGLGVDDELLYVASLLHDLGLTERYRVSESGAACFALRGAEGARKLIDGFEWPERRGHALAEAIALHLNLSVGIEYGAEALLLNAATALDVTGLRIWEVHPDSVRAVIDRHPRLAMKAEILPAWQREANTHPGTRAHFLSRYLQFPARIRGAPFTD